MQQLSERHHRYWDKNVRMTALLMVIWFVVTYVVAFWHKAWGRKRRSRK